MSDSDFSGLDDLNEAGADGDLNGSNTFLGGNGFSGKYQTPEEAIFGDTGAGQPGEQKQRERKGQSAVERYRARAQGIREGQDVDTKFAPDFKEEFAQLDVRDKMELQQYIQQQYDLSDTRAKQTAFSRDAHQLGVELDIGVEKKRPSGAGNGGPGRSSVRRSRRRPRTRNRSAANPPPEAPAAPAAPAVPAKKPSAVRLINTFGFQRGVKIVRYDPAKHRQLLDAKAREPMRRWTQILGGDRGTVGGQLDDYVAFAAYVARRKRAAAEGKRAQARQERKWFADRRPDQQYRQFNLYLATTVVGDQPRVLGVLVWAKFDPADYHVAAARLPARDDLDDPEDPEDLDEPDALIEAARRAAEVAGLAGEGPEEKKLGRKKKNKKKKKKLTHDPSVQAWFLDTFDGEIRLDGRPDEPDDRLDGDEHIVDPRWAVQDLGDLNRSSELRFLLVDPHVRHTGLEALMLAYVMNRVAKYRTLLLRLQDPEAPTPAEQRASAYFSPVRLEGEGGLRVTDRGGQAEPAFLAYPEIAPKNRAKLYGDLEALLPLDRRPALGRLCRRTTGQYAYNVGGLAFMAGEACRNPVLTNRHARHYLVDDVPPPLPPRGNLLEDAPAVLTPLVDLLGDA